MTRRAFGLFVSAPLLALALVFGLGLASSGDLQLKLQAHFAPAPATVRVVVTLTEPAAEDRRVYLNYDGQQAGSSFVQCPCSKQIVFDKVLRDLPAGDYFVQAILLRVTEQGEQILQTPIQTLVVTGGLRDF